MSDTLKPCPFCPLDKNSYIELRSVPIHPYLLDHYVFCRMCGARGPSCRTPEKAAQEWNTRPIEAAIRADSAELEAAAREVLNELWETNDEFTEYQQALWEKVPLS